MIQFRTNPGDKKVRAHFEDKLSGLGKKYFTNFGTRIALNESSLNHVHSSH
jgi:hypothetical protein